MFHYSMFEMCASVGLSYLARHVYTT